MDVAVIVAISSYQLWTSPLIFRSAVRYTNWSTIFVLQCSRKKRGYGKGKNFSRVQSNRIRWIRRFEVWKSDYHRVENFCILYERSFIYRVRIIPFIRIPFMKVQRGYVCLLDDGRLFHRWTNVVILFWCKRCKFSSSNRTSEGEEERWNLKTSNFLLKLYFHICRRKISNGFLQKYAKNFYQPKLRNCWVSGMLEFNKNSTWNFREINLSVTNFILKLD